MGYQALIDKATKVTGSTDDRHTRWPDFHAVEKKFEVTFTLDASATAESTKCPRHYDLKANGLKQSWGFDVVWVNPPWSNIGPWVEKAWREANPFTALFLPNDRAEQVWWQKWVEPWRDDRAGRQSLPAPDAVRCRLMTWNLPGRPCFDLPGGGSAGEQPMCGVVVLTLDRRKICA